MKLEMAFLHYPATPDSWAWLLTTLFDCLARPQSPLRAKSHPLYCSYNNLPKMVVAAVYFTRPSSAWETKPLQLGFRVKEPHSYMICLFPVTPIWSYTTPTTLHTAALIFILSSNSMRGRKRKKEGRGNRSTAYFFPFRKAHCFQQRTLM